MFEQAIKLKLRFDINGRILNAEDLYDLPLTKGAYNLNDLAKSLNKQIKDAQEEDFVAVKTQVNEVLDLKFAIVKHIIGVKVAEQTAAAEAKAKRENNQKILERIARKQDEELDEKSIEELKALLA